MYPKLWKAYTAAAVAGTVLLAIVGLPFLDKIFGGGALPTWESRKEVWDRALYMLQDFPFTGIGAGTFVKVLPVLYPLFLTTDDVFHSHNLYLQVAVDFGFFGLVSFSGLLACAGILSLRSYRRFRSKGDIAGMMLITGYCCGLFAMLLHGLVDSPLWLTKPHAVPFLFMGMLVGLYRAAPGEADEHITWRHTLGSIGLWFMVTLLAISFVGNHTLWALAIAIGGSLYVGWHEISPRFRRGHHAIH
jgi:O-antigen ligase